MKRLKIQVQPPSDVEPVCAFLSIPKEIVSHVSLEGFKKAQTRAYESLGIAVLSMSIIEEIHHEI
jgi:hypothetical protein